MEIYKEGEGNMEDWKSWKNFHIATYCHLASVLILHAEMRNENGWLLDMLHTGCSAQISTLSDESFKFLLFLLVNSELWPSNFYMQLNL
jgi:hypothetical protein